MTIRVCNKITRSCFAGWIVVKNCGFSSTFCCGRGQRQHIEIPLRWLAPSVFCNQWCIYNRCRKLSNKIISMLYWQISDMFQFFSLHFLVSNRKRLHNWTQLFNIFKAENSWHFCHSQTLNNLRKSVLP